MSEGQSRGQVGDERKASGASEDRSDTNKAKLLLGRVAAVLGILVSLPPVVVIPGGTSFLTFTAIVLGGMGYVLGARRLGVATVVIAAVALILGFMALRGYVPTI